MKKRNLILIALAITMLLVFTQIGAMARPNNCILIPGGACPHCPGVTGSTCHTGGYTCNAPYYDFCCEWAQEQCNPDDVRDNTDCGMCC